MEQRDRNEWENQWEGAFENASETPSPLVWKGIEASLASGNGPSNAWWLWVAAAFLGGVVTTASLFFMLSDSDNSPLALEKNGKVDIQTNSSANITIDQFEINDKPTANSSSYIQSKTNERLSLKRKPNSASRVSSANNNALVNDESLLAILAENISDKAIASIELNGLKPLYPNLMPEESMAKAEIKGVFIFDPSKFKPKESSNQKDWLAGLALSSGAFQQGANGQAATDMSTISAAPRNQGYVRYSDMAVSSTVGMNLGRRVSDRWVVFGGMGYQVTTNQSTSNLMLVSETAKDDINVVGELSSNGFGFSDPAIDGYRLEPTKEEYKMQNSYKFVTVPVSVGYFLIDKKWKLNLNAGLNTDIFYQYSSKAETGELQDYVVKPSDDANWKYLNMSVAGGLELSRVMANSYWIALSPGYRHALSEFGVSGNNQLQPNVFQVTVKFNYIF